MAAGGGRVAREGGFTGAEARLGRERMRDDLATIAAVRKAVGEDMDLMVDFNQGLNLGEALQRCHVIDELGLAWIEEPIVYDNFDGYAQLAAELKTRSKLVRTSMGPVTCTRLSSVRTGAFLRHAFLRRDLAKVSKATASTMMMPMMICWM